MKTRAPSFSLLFLCASLALAHGGTLDSFLRDAGCIRVPLERTADNRMIVRGTLNGASLALCVDTGSGGTLINVRRAERFKLVDLRAGKNIFGAVGRTLPTTGTVSRSMTLGKLNIGRFPFRVSQLELNASQSARPVDGVLGMDFLGAAHAIVDCVNAVLYFPPPASSQRIATDFRAGLIAGGAAEVPLSRLMTLQAAVRNQTFRLLVDTGSAFTTIDHAQLETLRLRPASSPYVITAIGNQQHRIGTTTVKNLRLGDCVIRESTIGASDFSELNTNLAEQGLPRIQGLLGCELLWLYGGIVDCGNKRLYLTHRNGPERR